MISTLAVLSSLPPLTPDTGIPDLVSLAFTAIVSGQWSALAALALFVAVWALRRFGGGRIPWLLTPRGGAVTVLVLSVLGAGFTALLAGEALSVSLVVTALGVAFTATGGRKLLLSLLSGEDPAAEAQAAGVAAGSAAAATVTDAQSAADALGRLGR